MISRSVPTYTYSDLWHSLKRRSQQGSDQVLRSRLAEMHHVKYVFLLDSARVALYALLKAYNRPGGVLMPAYTCIVVPEAVCYAGYTPVFVDIDYHSLNLTTKDVRQALRRDITVILATHLFGIPCELDELSGILDPDRVLLVEDAAAALGAEYQCQPVGSFGNAAILSFQATKVVAGEAGGALLTNDDNLATKVTRLLETAVPPVDSWQLFAKSFARKMVTSDRLYSLTQFGYRALHGEEMFEIVTPQNHIPQRFLANNSPFSNALITLQLDRLKWNLSRRRKLAQIYQEFLAGHPKLTHCRIPHRCLPAWIQYPIFVEDKKAFYKHMQHAGVDLSWTYRYSCADSYKKEGYPNAKKAAQTVVGLPTYPLLLDQQARAIARSASLY